MDAASLAAPRCNARGRPLPYLDTTDGSGDIYWRMNDVKGMREMELRGGATRQVVAKDTPLSTFKTHAPQSEPAPEGKGPHAQDSDVDSGIVGCSKPGQRVGSTSSADTDSSQEARQKDEFCLPVSRKESEEKITTAHFRTLKRNACLVHSGNPIKGDHSVLKECNRRPPTPLTVLGEANHYVRFDDQLQLSAQSIRHSCRKLFATLYAQRFSYPTPNSRVQEGSPTVPGEGKAESHRSCVQTAPDGDVRRHSVGHDRLRIPKSRASLDSTNKENSAGLNSAKKAVSWNLSHPGYCLQRQMTVPDSQILKQVSISPGITSKELRISGNIPINLDCQASLKLSTDSGIAGCRGKCTCQTTNSGSNSSGFSSQSSTSSNSSASTNHSCCCSQSSPKLQPPSSPSLYKSSSCSTLSKMLTQSGQRPPSQNTTVVNSSNETSEKVPLQKTSSCSNLMNRHRNVSFAHVPVYGDTMMHVYAQVASVVPENSSQAGSQQDLPSQKLQDLSPRRPQDLPSQRPQDYIYDTVRSPPVAVPPGILRQSRCEAGIQGYKQPPLSLNTVSVSQLSSQVNSRPGDGFCYETRGIYCRQAVNVQTSSVEPRLPAHNPRYVTLRRGNQRNAQNPYGTATFMPATITAQNSEKQNGYLKSALKQPKTYSHQNVLQASQAQGFENSNSARIPSEAQYAVVDKTKKSRFASLPALNNYVPEEKGQPPVPPKKNLHKSEFDLHRSRSSSPKKGFREKMNELTKSAKSAFQRAFSTERIYRPEREERLEATGQYNFHRSKSFIKGLRASLSKKRKKTKPPMAEVVPQASCNPIWDEQPSGPNSPIHVRGQLLQLNLDGSQVVELSKPPAKPYGFFVARGRVRNCRGVFVSRMRDQETQKQLAGLLDIGDEILEIEGHSVKDADIMEVNNLMANKNTLLLTVLPYICRKDI